MARNMVDGPTAVIIRISLEKSAVDVTRMFFGYSQQTILSCRSAVSYRRLVEMPHVIKLVAGDETFVGTAAHLGGIGNPANMRLVHIAVGPLSPGDPADNRIHPGFQKRIGGDL